MAGIVLWLPRTNPLRHIAITRVCLLRLRIAGTWRVLQVGLCAGLLLRRICWNLLLHNNMPMSCFTFEKKQNRSRVCFFRLAGSNGWVLFEAADRPFGASTAIAPFRGTVLALAARWHDGYVANLESAP